ncbi:hypothetical protein SORBI_3003G198150 [Sorghum bicolor]|uniref:Uncharacterized protein n=1 Tax=Sorghum bicolor TaxID=4558 RepID=C5XNU9_SORBI|nr:hypothetical protein SORBI_3003G198150 [Sorghum bicolor]
MGGERKPRRCRVLAAAHPIPAAPAPAPAPAPPVPTAAASTPVTHTRAGTRRVHVAFPPSPSPSPRRLSLLSAGKLPAPEPQPQITHLDVPDTGCQISIRFFPAPAPQVEEGAARHPPCSLHCTTLFGAGAATLLPEFLTTHEEGVARLPARLCFGDSGAWAWTRIRVCLPPDAREVRAPDLGTDHSRSGGT